MIQRIQSVYLLVAVAFGVALFFMPLAYLGEYVLDVYGIRVEEHSSFITIAWPVTGLAIITTLNPFIIIFLFKKRNLQVLLGKLNILLLAALLTLIFVYSDKLGNLPLNGNNYESMVGYSYGTFIPVIPLIFTYLAVIAIRKDAELLQSANRIR